MKTLVLGFLSVYQVLVSPLLHAITGSVRACRYSVSCSAYARQVIERYGVVRGGFLAFKRVASCHPFAKVAVNQV